MGKKDEELRILADNEIKELEDDKLNYKSYANALKDIIINSETPIVIGIYGAWDIGKTSLMKMIKKLLEEEDSIANTVWFDAWKYEKKYDLRIALIHRILKELENKFKNKKLKKIIKRFINSIDWINVINIPFNIVLNHIGIKVNINDIFKKFDKTLTFIHQFEDRFNKLIKDFSGKEKRGL